MQDNVGDTFINGGARTTIRVANTTRMVFHTNNQHTLTGSLTVSGSVTQNSDRILKTNITDISIEEVKQLLSNISPKEYTRTDTNTQRIGFIANDFDDNLPEKWKNSIVGTTIINQITDEENNTSGGEEIKTLDYARLTTILWSVCQSLNERIKVL